MCFGMSVGVVCNFKRSALKNSDPYHNGSLTDAGLRSGICRGWPVRKGFINNSGTAVAKPYLVSVLGSTSEDTPKIVPHTVDARRLLLGMESRKRAFEKTRKCNDYKVATHGRALAISRFADHLRNDVELQSTLCQVKTLPE